MNNKYKDFYINYKKHKKYYMHFFNYLKNNNLDIDTLNNSDLLIHYDNFINSVSALEGYIKFFDMLKKKENKKVSDRFRSFIASKYRYKDINYKRLEYSDYEKLYEVFKNNAYTFNTDWLNFKETLKKNHNKKEMKYIYDSLRQLNSNYKKMSIEGLKSLYSFILDAKPKALYEAIYVRGVKNER